MSATRHSGLDALLGANAETMPIAYGRALLPRIEALLRADLSPDVRRQLLAVKDALDDPALSECKGLDRLHYFLDQLESRCAYLTA